MNRLFDVIIVGAGIFGSAIFYHLLRNGSKRVLLLEKARSCNGASGASGGFVRLLHSSEQLCELAAGSFDEFANFQAKTGYSCGYIKTGFYTIETADKRTKLEPCVSTLQKLGYDIEFISALDAQKTFTNCSYYFSENDVVVYEPDSGYADPLKTCIAYLRAGVQLGGSFLENVSVEKLMISNDQIVGVKTTSGAFNAPCVVLATGSKINSLLSELGYGTNIFESRLIQIGFYRYPTTQKIPSFVDHNLGLYGRDFDGTSCLFGITNDISYPHEENPTFSIEFSQKIRNIAAKSAPWVHDSELVMGRCGIDSFTSDNTGIADFSDKVHGLFICSGWSGIGFKLAPECAKRAAKKIRAY